MSDDESFEGMCPEPIIIEGPDGPVTVHADPNATDSTPQLAGEWGPIPVVELTPEELVERYPESNRRNGDAQCVSAQCTVSEHFCGGRTFRDTATPKAKAAWDKEIDGYELRPAAYLDNPRPHFTVKDGEWPKLTEQQMRDLQAANARQVRDEWIAAGRPGERPVVEGPLRIRIEPSPGFGKTWLSLLACCGYLRGVVDEKVFMGDLAP